MGIPLGRSAIQVVVGVPQHVDGRMGNVNPSDKHIGSDPATHCSPPKSLVELDLAQQIA